MLVLDLAKVVGVVNDSSDPCFSEMLFKLLFKADKDNFRLLKAIYPEEAKMVEVYRATGDIVNIYDLKYGYYTQDKENGGYKRVEGDAKEDSILEFSLLNCNIASRSIPLQSKSKLEALEESLKYLNHRLIDGN
jgi:hypothetical protein